MNMVPVMSSDLSQVGYDPTTRQLQIVFKSGGTYLYNDVLQSEYQGLLSATSKGRYFHAYIKQHNSIKLR